MSKSKASRKKTAPQSDTSISVAAQHHDRELTRTARRKITKSVDKLLEQFSQPKAFASTSQRKRQTKDLRLDYDRLRNAAQALMTWHTNERYLDSDGRPANLPKTGKKSLQSLANDCGTPSDQHEQLVSDLVTFAFVTPVAKKFAPSNRSAVIGARSPLILAHAVSAICHLIDTVSHNVSEKKLPRYERQLAPVKIKQSDLPVFLHFVEQQSQYLLDAIDDWLIARSKEQRPGENYVSVGIGAYSWIDETDGSADA